MSAFWYPRRDAYTSSLREQNVVIERGSPIHLFRLLNRLEASAVETCTSLPYHLVDTEVQAQHNLHRFAQIDWGNKFRLPD